MRGRGATANRGGLDRKGLDPERGFWPVGEAYNAWFPRGFYRPGGSPPRGVAFWGGEPGRALDPRGWAAPGGLSPGEAATGFGAASWSGRGGAEDARCRAQGPPPRLWVGPYIFSVLIYFPSVGTILSRALEVGRKEWFALAIAPMAGGRRRSLAVGSPIRVRRGLVAVGGAPHETGGGRPPVDLLDGGRLLQLAAAGLPARGRRALRRDLQEEEVVARGEPPLVDHHLLPAVDPAERTRRWSAGRRS